MKSDITPPKPSILGRFTPKDHEHRWHFLQTRTESEQINPGNSDMFRKIEYAYYVCNDCPDTDGDPNTIKRRVELKGDEK